MNFVILRIMYNKFKYQSNKILMYYDSLRKFFVCPHLGQLR